MYALSIVPVLLAVEHGVASVAYVEGRSMAPTLNGDEPPKPIDEKKKQDISSLTISSSTYDSAFTNKNVAGETILIRKAAYRPARGDVVVLDNPGKPGQQIVKRLVAMEGDVIMYLAPTRRRSIDDLRTELLFRQQLFELEPKLGSDGESLRELFEALGRRGELEVETKKEASSNHDESSAKREENTNITSIPPIPTNHSHSPPSTPHADDPTSSLSSLLSPSDNAPHTHELTGNDESSSKNEVLKKINNVWFEDVRPVLVRVPMGHCWVEGDNPQLSRDSRDFGPVPLGLVRGIVVGVMWPPSRVGFIQNRRGSPSSVVYYDL